jgi:hypothetical protein
MLIKGLYKGTKKTEMTLAVCSRTNDVVEPMIKPPQWFVNCKTLAKVGLDAVRSKKIEIIPQQYEKDWYRYIYPEFTHLIYCHFFESCLLSNQLNKQKKILKKLSLSLQMA